MRVSGRRSWWLLGVFCVALLIATSSQLPWWNGESGVNGTGEQGRAWLPSLSGPAVPAEDALRDVLRRRAAAIRAGDEHAFMATVDPAGVPKWRETQRAMFTNLREVPLSTWDLELSAEPTVVRHPATAAGQVRKAKVRLRYALAGVDAVATDHHRDYAFARRDGSWYVTAAHGWRGPWDFAPCRVTRTAHGLILAHDDNQVLAQRVAAKLDEAVNAVTAVWGQDWTRRVAVHLPSSSAELRAAVGPDFNVDGIAAIAVADEVDHARQRVEGPRIVLNPHTVDRLSDAAMRVVLRHEITHIAARVDTVDGAPMWLLEGFADYVGYRGSGLRPEQIAPELAKRVREGGFTATVPSNADFQTQGRELDLAYQKAWSLIVYVRQLLEQRHGEHTLVELYREISGQTTESAADRVLVEYLGIDRQRLRTQWQEYLRAEFR